MNTYILFVEELKATLRGRFAWLGATLVLCALGALATVGTQDTWLDGYGIIAYGLVPLAFIPLAAVMLASPRANRFVESVFTAPVERHEWLTAKILVLLTLTAAYYVALMPMMFVYVRHVGVPPLLHRFLIWTPGLLISSVAVGTLIGVLFIGRSIAAPAGAAMGVLLAYAGLIPLQELMVAQGNGATRTGHVTLISPPVLLKNALGFSLVANSIPATTTLTWMSLLIIVLGSLALATWVFLRAQGVETWELSPAQGWAVAAVGMLIAIAPLVLADTNYDRPAPPATNAPPIRALFARAGSSLAMAAPGGQPPGRCCGTILNRDAWPFGIDEATRQDLLVLLPVDTSERVSNLSIQVAGENGLEVTVDPDALARAERQLETRAYPPDLGPPAADGHRITTGWVARVPVTLTPTRPWDVGGVRYPLNVTATYEVGGERRPRSFSARAAVDAQVSSAIYEMGAASAVFPLLCLTAAIRRWVATR